MLNRLDDLPAAAARHHWALRLQQELAQNVLPWWQQQIFDAEGRVLGGRGNDGAVRELPRTAVLGTRLLWTFASAQVRALPSAVQAQAAQRAWDWVSGPLTDRQHGGLFWSVDACGQPLADHKQSYAQAFAIYALTACHRWQCVERGVPPSTATVALAQAMQLFGLLEAHAADPLEGGYFEGCTRDWQVLPGAKLSEQEPPAPKSMNTMLHVLEALTELLSLVPEVAQPAVAARLRQLLQIFLERIWLPGHRCFGLFFSRDWQNQTPQVSWGHDIETSWLLVRAAQVLGDPALLQRCQALALEVADAVLARGMTREGRVHGAGLFDGTVTDARSHWWCQAEAMVGFWDAWQIGGDPRFARAAAQAWAWAEQHHVDPVGGDWFKILDEHGVPLDTVPKAGPWECPYHHVRACLEMSERLEQGGAA